MIQREFLPILQEFVARAEEVPNLVCAILYGSVAKGNADRRSDIDMFLVFSTPHDPEKGKEFEVAHKIASEIQEELGVTNRFQFVFSNLKLGVDEGFLENLCKEGVIIWGRPIIVDVNKLQLSPKTIVSYDISGLSNYEKLRIHRALYGYEVERVHKGKRYVSRSRGLLAEVGGKRIGRAVILIPRESTRYLKRVFDESKVKYRALEVWSS